MSQTKWPLSSLPILKLDDLGAKQACAVLYTTCYEMIRHLPTVDSLFSTMPDMECLTFSTCLYSQ